MQYRTNIDAMSTHLRYCIDIAAGLSLACHAMLCNIVCARTCSENMVHFLYDIVGKSLTVGNACDTYGDLQYSMQTAQQRLLQYYNTRRLETLSYGMVCLQYKQNDLCSLQGYSTAIHREPYSTVQYRTCCTKEVYGDNYYSTVLYRQ